jgi:hypothetical protein
MDAYLYALKSVPDGTLFINVLSYPEAPAL